MRCKFLEENVVEMGENFIHSFQGRDKLENRKILSTHSKGERGWKRGMGEIFLCKLKKKGGLREKNNCSPIPKEDVEERKIKLSIHFQRREGLAGDEKRNHPFQKRKKLEAKSTRE
jgi:hypothetical protein